MTAPRHASAHSMPAPLSGDPAAGSAGGSPAVPPPGMVVARLSAMGDVALTTGVLHHWWQCHGIRFIVVTRAAFAPLFDHHPAVIKVIGLAPDDLHGARQAAVFRQLAAAHAGMPLVDLHGTLRTRRLALVWKGRVFRYPKHGLRRRLFLLTRGRFGRTRLRESNVPQRYAMALEPLFASPSAHGQTPETFVAPTPPHGTSPARHTEAHPTPKPEPDSSAKISASAPTAPAMADIHPAHAPVPREELRPRLFLSAEEKAWAQAKLSPLRTPSRADIPASLPSSGAGAASRPVAIPPVIALHPFATHETKTWPAACWLDLARRLTAEDIPFFWVGQGKRPAEAQNGPSSPRACPGNATNNSHHTAFPTDVSLSSSAPAMTPGSARQQPAFLDFTNRTTLRQLMALLDQADVLITGDSGPMHLASGTDTPVLALFGPTCEEWGFFPSGKHDRVLQTALPCRPCSLHGKAALSCGHDCMRSLTPAMVMDAVKAMLSPAV